MGVMRPTALATVLVLVLAPSGCAAGDDQDGAGTVTVYAAASLTGTFEEISEEFEATHEGVDVQLVFGGSSDLVAQIQEGAPADVFASADLANMEKLTAEGLDAR